MKVSVIIPTYNRLTRLLEAVDSVVKQTRKPEEIIIIDDASEFTTEQLIKDLEFGGINIKYERTPVSKGAAYSRNRGAKLAEGDILMFLDDDDTWEGGKIETQLNVFNQNDQIGLVYSGRLVVGNLNRDKIIYKIQPQFSGNLYPRILYENVVGVTSSVAIKKSLFRKVEGFDEELPAREDYDLWIRCAQHTIINHDNSCHLRYTILENSNLQMSAQPERNILANSKILEKYKMEIASQGLINARKIKSTMFFHVAKILRNKSLKEALPWIWLSFVQYPNLKTLTLILPIKSIQKLRSLGLTQK